MLSIDVAAIAENIRAMKEDFRQAPDRRNAFERVLRDYYDRLRMVQSPSQEDMVQSLHVLYRALNSTEPVDRELLINFIAVVIRFVENAGVGYAFSKAFIDKAIHVYRQAGFSPIELYQAKADLLRLDQLESDEREQALLEAKHYAEGADDAEALLKVLLSCAVYYTEVSQYQKALQACQESEQLIERHSHLHKYKPRLLTFFAMNYTPLFNYQFARSYLVQAKALLDAERDQWDDAESREIWVSSMETVYHYLGRIYEAEGHLQEAMYHYIEGYYTLQMLAREPRSRLAFYHLRLAELLISASLLEQARDHLRLSQKIFDAIKFSSSGRLQVSVAWAALYNKEGDYARARDYILDAREEARDKHFPRGELWCLVKLFWLELGHLHLYPAIITAIQTLGTWRHGELRRNETARLLGHYLFQVLAVPFKLLNRTPHTVMGAGTLNVKLQTCICPLHQLPASSSRGSFRAGEENCR